MKKKVVPFICLQHAVCSVKQQEHLNERLDWELQ